MTWQGNIGSSLVERRHFGSQDRCSMVVVVAMVVRDLCCMWWILDELCCMWWLLDEL